MKTERLENSIDDKVGHNLFSIQQFSQSNVGINLDLTNTRLAIQSSTKFHYCNPEKPVTRVEKMNSFVRLTFPAPIILSTYSNLPSAEVA